MLSTESLGQLLDSLSSLQASDLHITSGHTPFYRDKNGDITPLTQMSIIAAGEIESTILSILPKNKISEYEEYGEADFSYASGARRFRVNAYRNIAGPSLAIRAINETIPSIQEMQFTKEIIELTKKEGGLILVTGPTGSGKSTTLAALIEYINTQESKHIITIEDPIEYSFSSKKSLIHQREVGSHTKSFGKAIRSALREDPDVILV